MKRIIREYLKSLQNVYIEKDVPLSSLTSFRIGGKAAAVVHPLSEEALCGSIGSASAAGVPFKILGFGTNILAPDDGYDGILIRIDRPLYETEITGCTVRCSAGDSLASVSKRSVSEGLTGMEGLAGIPGSVGGACAMNAGAYGYEMKQILSSVRVLRNGEVLDLPVRDEDMRTRWSAFSAPGTVLLSAVLTLQPDDGCAVERMKDYSSRRKDKQPLELPSAGSVFKRPPGRFAGQLIEQCGLKGVSEGGAQVSAKHAGFIVNTGGATCADVRILIGLIQDRVFQETGVLLERELKYWEEV